MTEFNTIQLSIEVLIQCKTLKLKNAETKPYKITSVY
jgi:hypothetical protein